MSTLDLRGSGGTLRLTPNGGSATVRSFVVVGQQGPAGPPGPAVSVAPGDLTVSDNGDGTVTFATAASGALVDNNDGTATIAV